MGICKSNNSVIDRQLEILRTHSKINKELTKLGMYSNYMIQHYYISRTTMGSIDSYSF